MQWDRLAHPDLVDPDGGRGDEHLDPGRRVPVGELLREPVLFRDAEIQARVGEARSDHGMAGILGTLVVQGLTLPGVIRWLGLEDDGLERKEDTKARIRAAEAALARLDELVEEEWVRPDTAERMRGAYSFRVSRFSARFDGEDDGSIEERSASYQRLRRELLEAERAEIVALRRQGRISDDVMRGIERDLDLEDSRLDI